ncbi:MAG: RHS repeat-associated core domain-containing protein [Anaerolineae bacterium]
MQARTAPKRLADGVRASKTTDGTTTDYVLDLAPTLPVVISDTDAIYLYGLDIIAEQLAQSDRYYYMHDGLRSVRQLLDNTGQIAETYAYDPFGVPLASDTVPNPYRFTGEAWDPEVELLYLRARYYQPATGRFITKDPWRGYWGERGELNAYLYSSGNPVNLVDPSGLQGEGLREDLQELDRRLRRAVTGPLFGLRAVVLNRPIILYYANLYGVDPAMVASIVYWESDAIERLSLNAVGLLPFWVRSPVITCSYNADLWQFLLAGDASIGIGQTYVWRAKYLEDEARVIHPVTPDAPLLGRETLIALRLTVDAESIRYVAANVADLQLILREEAVGLGLSASERRMLILAGYNAGQESVQDALRMASAGDRRELGRLLSLRYAAIEVGPMYERLRGLFR